MRKILILASNPKRDLALDREIRDLEGVVKRSRNRDEFEVRVGSAVRPEDLQELLLEYEPQIVHFCGHGTGEQGLVFQNTAGREQMVTTSALSSLFKLFTGKVDCVLLNACYSEVQAAAISQHINYVIGMSQTILDDAAIAFATGFYRGLGYGRTTEDSYHFGCNAIELMPSTTVISRSPTAPQERKLTAEFTVIPGAPIAVPEHLKPILKTRETLAAQSSGVNVPAVPTSETKRVEIAQDVSNALEREASLKRYRSCVRDFLADGVLTPEEKLQLGQLAQQLGLNPAEAVTIFQEEERLRFAQRSDRSTASAEMLPLVSSGMRSRPVFQKPLLLMGSGLVALLGTALLGVVFHWGSPESTQPGEPDPPIIEESSGGTVVSTPSFIPSSPTNKGSDPAKSPEEPQISEADQGHLNRIQEVFLKVDDVPGARVEAEEIKDASVKQQANDLIANKQQAIDQARSERIQKYLQDKNVEAAKAEAEKIEDPSLQQQANVLIANAVVVQPANPPTVVDPPPGISQPSISPTGEVTVLPDPQCYKVHDSSPRSVRSDDDITDGVMGEKIGELEDGATVISGGKTQEAHHADAPNTSTWLQITEPIQGWVSMNDLESVACSAVK
jgi:CHAT domain